MLSKTAPKLFFQPQRYNIIRSIVCCDLITLECTNKLNAFAGELLSIRDKLERNDCAQREDITHGCGGYGEGVF